jgi:hypothetical protein
MPTSRNSAVRTSTSIASPVWPRRRPTSAASAGTSLGEGLDAGLASRAAAAPTLALVRPLEGVGGGRRLAREHDEAERRGDAEAVAVLAQRVDPRRDGRRVLASRRRSVWIAIAETAPTWMTLRMAPSPVTA